MAGNSEYSGNGGASEIAGDFLLPFQVEKTPVRGRVARLSGAIDQILSAHKLPGNVLELLGEAVCLTAMIGSSLKMDGKLIFQAQGDGPVPLVVANYGSDGRLRASARMERDEPSHSGMKLIGAGHIAITIDQGPDMERYQGVTPIEGATLANAAVSYFDQSEQIPTVVKLAVGKLTVPGQNESWRAGGLIAQFVPGEGGARERGEAAIMNDEDRESWDRAAAFAETTQIDELLDPNVSAETLLYRLFHDDGVRVFNPLPLRAECDCNAAKIAAVLTRYSEDELKEMIEGGVITVTCEFCRKAYRFSPDGTQAATE